MQTKVVKPSARHLRENQLEIKQDFETLSELEREPGALCKLSQYVKAKEDKGNTTLKLSVNAVKTMAILDIGARVSILTSGMWEVWGKRAIRKIRMGLQMADGEIKYPLGLLENIHINIYGIQVEHTFTVVDSGRNTNYDFILGRPFMRQFYWWFRIGDSIAFTYAIKET